MSDSTELKHLQTLLSNEKHTLYEQQSKITVCRQAYNKINRRIKSLEYKIDKLTTHIVVSEHAILRYLERVEKFDLEGIKKKILLQEKAMDSLGDGKFPCDGGGRAVLVDNTVVSVIN